MIGTWVLRLLTASRAAADPTTSASSQAATTGGRGCRCGIGDGTDAARSGGDTRFRMPRSRCASDPAAAAAGLARGGGAADARAGARWSVSRRARAGYGARGRSAAARARARVRTALGADRRAGTAARRGTARPARGGDARTTMSDPPDPESERGCPAGAGVAGCSPADSVGAAAVGTGEGTAVAATGAGSGCSTGGAVGVDSGDRGGSSPSGSRYPWGWSARRMPRCTYGCGSSTSPDAPIPPTTSPSATRTPLATAIEPRWVSVTA